jgi:F-box domain
MPTNLLDMPYEIIRLLTSHLSLKAALRLSECCRRLASFLDYNHDPRIDKQRATKREIEKNCVNIMKKLVLVKHIDILRMLLWTCTVGEEEMVRRLLLKPRIDAAC